MVICTSFKNETRSKAKSNIETFNTLLVEQIQLFPFDNLKTFDETTEVIKYNIEC